MEDETLKVQPTLCWSCKNAVPKIVDGKLVRGCSWSVRLQPVKGWFAEEDVKNSGGSTPMKTYCVLDCPEYAPDENNGEEGAPGARYDDGYVRIAAIVLKKQISAYHTALEQYARTEEEKYLHKVKSIERELRTTYYAALTMNIVDMDAFIVQCRKNHCVDLGV